MPIETGGTKAQKMSMMPLVAVLLFGASFVGGYMVGGAKGAPQPGGSGYDAGYAAGMADAASKMEESGLLPPTLETKTVTGTVVSIDASSMVLEVPQLVRNPLDTPAPTTRTVRLSSTTKYTELVPKSPEEVRKEIEAFTPPKPGEENAVPPAPPSPFTTKSLKLSDIAAGAMVSVTATTDILRAETFDAAEVQLVQRPNAQAGAPVTPDAGIPPAAAPAGAPVTP